MRVHESWDCTDKQDYCRHRRVCVDNLAREEPACNRTLWWQHAPSGAGKHSETDAVEEWTRRQARVWEGRESQCQDASGHTWQTSVLSRQGSSWGGGRHCRKIFHLPGNSPLSSFPPGDGCPQQGYCYGWDLKALKILKVSLPSCGPPERWDLVEVRSS